MRETAFSFPGGCCCVNKNEEWKTKAALCSLQRGLRESVWSGRETEGGERREKRERGYNGQKASKERRRGEERRGEITGDERELEWGGEREREERRL